MKKRIILLIAIYAANSLQAQNIGFGTTTPHPSAKLEIKSSTGGLLIPRLSAANRTDITTPPAGLMVYDHTNERFFFHNGTTWRTISDNTYWSRKGNFVYTSNNVGLGTSAPAAALHVTGGARVSGDLKIIRSTGTQNRINFDFTGINSSNLAQGLYFNIGELTQSFIVFNYSDIVGENRFRLGFNNSMSATIRASGEFTFNALSGTTLQLQTGGTDKGYIQLSGDDVRAGIYATNPTGQFIIRNNGDNKVYITDEGNVGIGTSTPDERLHVAGTIKASGKIGAAAIESSSIEITGEVRKPYLTGSYNLVPLAYGRVYYDGSILSATPNVSVVRTSKGIYEILVPGLTSACTIIADGAEITSGKYVSAGKCKIVNETDVSEGNDESFKVDAVFHFIIFQP